MAVPLRCISLEQNLNLKSWILIKNSLTNYSLGIHINHQYRYPICALVYLLIYFMEYTYTPHCPHSTASVTPKSTNWYSNDLNHAVTIPSNLTPAFASRLADLFISFLFARWALIYYTKWDIHNPISQTNSSLVRPLWIKTMLLHKRSLLMSSKTSKVKRWSGIFFYILVISCLPSR